MSGKLALDVKKPPVPDAPRDPKRAALAQAIETFTPYAAAIESASAGLAKAQARQAEAEALLRRARGDLDQARGDQTARSVAAAARGEGPEPDAILREARRTAANADDDVEIAAAIVDSLQTTLSESEYAARKARGRVDEAAKAVLLAETDRLRSWVLEAEAEHARRGEIISFVVGLNSWNTFDPARNTLAAFASLHAGISGRRNDYSALPWIEALEALKLNALAPLPPTGAP